MYANYEVMFLKSRTYNWSDSVPEHESEVDSHETHLSLGHDSLTLTNGPMSYSKVGYLQCNHFAALPGCPSGASTGVVGAREGVDKPLAHPTYVMQVAVTVTRPFPSPFSRHHLLPPSLSKIRGGYCLHLLNEVLLVSTVIGGLLPSGAHRRPT